MASQQMNGMDEEMLKILENCEMIQTTDGNEKWKLKKNLIDREIDRLTTKREVERLQQELKKAEQKLQEERVINRQLEQEIFKQELSATKLSHFVARGAARSAIEVKGMEILNGGNDVPKFFENLVSKWSKKEPVWGKNKKGSRKKEEDSGKNEEDSGDNEKLFGVNTVAKKLLVKVFTYYQSLAGLGNDDSNQMSFKRHYKIWLYAVLFSHHETAVKLRKHLEEPGNENDGEAMDRYWTNVETFCAEVQTIYNLTSGGIHHPTEGLPRDEVARLVGKNQSQAFQNALKILLDIEA